jgi:beta-glucosidase
MKFYEPLTNTTEDILAAKRAMSFEIHWYVKVRKSFTSALFINPNKNKIYPVVLQKRWKLCSRLVVLRLFSCLFFRPRFLDPIFFGEYPKEMHEMLSSNLPEFTPAEKRLLQNKVDFIGVNHYTAIYTKDCISSPCNLNTYEGNALVFATGERDGVGIGKPVRTDFVTH